MNEKCLSFTLLTEIQECEFKRLYQRIVLKSSPMVTLQLGSAAIPVAREALLRQCTVFADDPTLLPSIYPIRSQVSLPVLRDFVSFIEGRDVAVTPANIGGLWELSSEFGFDRLLERFSQCAGSVDVQARTRLSAYEERLAAHERRLAALESRLLSLARPVHASSRSTPAPPPIPRPPRVPDIESLVLSLQKAPDGYVKTDEYDRGFWAARWEIVCVVERASGARFLCWHRLIFSPLCDSVPALVLPLLARLRFFITPLALNVFEHDGAPHADVLSEDFPNGQLIRAMAGLRGNGKRVDGFGPTEVSKCVFAIAFAMVQAYRVGSYQILLAPEAILLDSNLEPAIAGFIAFWHWVTLPGPHPERAILEPPEMLIGGCDVLTEEGSVYSFGITLFVLFGGESGHRNDASVARAIELGRRYPRPRAIPDGYWELVQECWCDNPLVRPKYGAIVDRLVASPDVSVPGTDKAAYAAYCARVSAEPVDPELATAVQEAITRYQDAHRE
jgi:hypothetical protein